MFIERTNSTNTLMREMIAKGEWPEGECFLRTDFQTAGRGQTGNRWESEEGKNLLCSILLPPRQNLFELNVITGVAVHRMISKLGISELTIKWPNDIYWRDKKVAGILIENAIIGNEVKYSIAGIGLNINQTEWLSQAPNPVSLKQIDGKERKIEEMMARLLQEINQALKEDVWAYYKAHLYRKEGFWPFVERDVSLEPTMNVQRDEVQGTKDTEQGKKVFMARIADICPTGEIVLEDQNGISKKYHFKEIRFVV